MRILGIDPGLQTTGYALVGTDAGRPCVLEAGVIRSDTRHDLPTRLAQLHDGLGEVLDQGRPAVMAVEQLYAHYDHPRTAILMAHARGVFLLAAGVRQIELVNYSATRVKKVITGSGRADKAQLQAAITRELNLPRPPQPHDVADALAIALCHWHLAQRRISRGSLAVTFTPVNRHRLPEAPAEVNGPGDEPARPPTRTRRTKRP